MFGLFSVNLPVETSVVFQSARQRRVSIDPHQSMRQRVLSVLHLHRTTADAIDRYSKLAQRNTGISCHPSDCRLWTAMDGGLYHCHDRNSTRIDVSLSKENFDITTWFNCGDNQSKGRNHDGRGGATKTLHQRGRDFW